MTSYSLFEASFIFSMGLSLNDLDDVPAISLLTTIFVPFSLVHSCFLSALCPSFLLVVAYVFFNNSSIHFFSSGVRIFSILLVLEGSL